MSAVKARYGIVLFGSLVGFTAPHCPATYASTKWLRAKCFPEGNSRQRCAAHWRQLSCRVAQGPVGTALLPPCAGMQMGQAATPDTGGPQPLAALGRQTTVRPGFSDQIPGWSRGACLPAGAVSGCMGQSFMKGLWSARPNPAAGPEHISKGRSA